MSDLTTGVWYMKLGREGIVLLFYITSRSEWESVVSIDYSIRVPILHVTNSITQNRDMSHRLRSVEHILMGL